MFTKNIGHKAYQCTLSAFFGCSSADILCRIFRCLGVCRLMYEAAESVPGVCVVRGLSMESESTE